MAVQSIAPAAQLDHAALDRIMTRLESRYGHDPRLDRAFRLFMGDRVELSETEPTTALVHGDSGKSYWATALGFCECPDHANGHVCKHQLATKIAAQMRAVEIAKRPEAKAEETRTTYLQLCQQQQQYGRMLHAQGTRPVDDISWLERDQHIQRVKAQLPPATLIR